MISQILDDIDPKLSNHSPVANSELKAQSTDSTEAADWGLENSTGAGPRVPWGHPKLDG